jgi:hypothetical protein
LFRFLITGSVMAKRVIVTASEARQSQDKALLFQSHEIAASLPCGKLTANDDFLVSMLTKAKKISLIDA